MADLSDLREFFKEHPQQVKALLDDQHAAIANMPELNILKDKYLSGFWNARPNKNLNFALIIEEAQLDNLDFSAIGTQLFEAIAEQLKTHCTIEVDKEFNIIDVDAKQISQDILLEKSNESKVVFFFGVEGIDLVIRGRISPKLNIFYNEEDKQKYHRLFHISQLPECLIEYTRYVHQPGVNEAFFASRKLIASLQPQNTPLNTLRNKPEKLLRDNLIAFLNRNTQHTFSKENELDNQRELDLYTEVEGRKYLIEVKWLGQSINDADDGFTQKLTDVVARDGVTQTLEYIEHLINAMSYNVHCGYLCVFDVREIKKPVNYRNFDFITAALLPYYKNHFKKLNEIPLNRIPSS